MKLFQFGKDLVLFDLLDKAARTTAAVAAKAATPATPGSLVFDKDTNGDGSITAADTPSFKPGSAATPAVPAIPGLNFEGDRNRYNVDTELFVLGGAIHAEAYWGREPVAAPATNALPAKMDLKTFGWYGQYTYNLGTANSISYRYDTYDPDKDSPDNTSTRMDASWNHYIGPNLKLTFNYEWYPKVPKGRVDDPMWTFQAQHKF